MIRSCHHSDKTDPIGRSSAPSPSPTSSLLPSVGTYPTIQGFLLKLPGGFVNWWGVYLDPLTHYRLNKAELDELIASHTTKPQTMWIEFTRDLNKPAAYFHNTKSCWWSTFGPGNWASSRCSLKNWGGFGIRSFESKTSERTTGRAWVFPFGAKGFPTHDTSNASCFLVVNGYGDLNTLAAATIMSDLTGLAHRWVQTPQPKEHLEVDESGGYLVAKREVMQGVGNVRMAFDNHDQFDAAQVRKAA